MKHTFEITVEVDPNWIKYLTAYNDIFESGRAGYWLRGVDSNETGWLCWEDDDKCRPGEEPNLETAKYEWKLGNPLPPHWFRLDKAAAIRTWEEGVKRWGVDWYDQTDSTREDLVVQLALLGEIKYG